MRKEKFVYNTHSLRYEKVEESVGTKVIRVFGFVCAAIFTAFIFTLVMHRYFPSPKERALMREIAQMQAEYSHLMSDFEMLNQELDHLQEKDAYAYRTIFGMDPIDEDVLEGGIGGHDEYAAYRQFTHSGEVLVSAKQRLRKLKHRMVMQSKSLDTILNLAEEKEAMLASIPSIKPVRSDKLARRVVLLSGYGPRIHPIFKVKKMHWGIDFTAPTGTPIQATGDGVVERVERRNSGYGYNVIIDHGYGYRTLYAHMSRIDVKAGQKVKRGQQLGLVGSSGTSTAPHCHYEIFYKGQRVNPINFVLDGLSPEEYQELAEAAAAVNQSLD